MTEIASAYISLMPSMRGFGKAAESQLGPQMSNAGKSGGNKISAAIGGVIKKSALGIGVSAGGVLGTALFSGFKRLNALDQAKAKLTGLGNSTKAVDNIMTNALNAVRGTAFGLDAAATTAAGAVAAGVKPGKDLERTLRLVADSATIAGTDMSAMGSIFNKVATSNKIQGDVIAQLSDAGIPVVQLLGKELGKSAEETVKLASAGKINFATFQNAMETGLGGAAQESGKTMSGAFANMKAALGRIGANLVSGIFPKIQGGIVKLTGFMSGIEPVAARVGEFVGSRLAPIGSALSSAVDPAQKIARITWGNLADGAGAIKDFFANGAGHEALAKSMEKIREAGANMRSGFTKASKAFGELRDSANDLDLSNIDTRSIGEALGKALVSALGTLGKMAAKITETLGKVFSNVDWVGIGIAIGKQAPALMIGLTAGILNLDFGTLLEGIKEHWFDILMGVLIIAFAPSKFLAPLTKLLAKIPFVGRFLAAAVTWLNDLGGKLVGFGGDLLRLFWRGFTESPLPGAGFVTRVLGALKSLPGKVKDFIGLLGTRIGAWALDAFEALGRGARGGMNGALKFVARIPGLIVRGLGKLADLLLPGGRDMIAGLLSGIRGKIGDAVNFVKKIPNRIVNAFGDPKAILSDIGGFIIDGLKAGISGAAHKVTEAIDAIISKIPKFIRNKLGIDSPSKVMRRLARWISVGIAVGMTDGLPSIIKAATDLAKGAQKKLLDGIQSMREKLRGKLQGLRSDFASLRDSIAQAFTGDIFNASATEAVIETITTAAVDGAANIWAAGAKAGTDKSSTEVETAPAKTAGQNFIESLIGSNADLGALKKAHKQLLKWGWSPKQLSQLFASGNTDLILELAGSKSLAKQGESLLATNTKLGNQLGTQVARADIGPKIDGTNARLDRLEEAINALPKKFGKEINGAASKAQRSKRTKK